MSNDPNVGALVEEYEDLLAEARAGTPVQAVQAIEDDRLTNCLSKGGGWTREGALHLVELARENGVFMLRNALALAIADGQHDGTLGY